MMAQLGLGSPFAEGASLARKDPLVASGRCFRARTRTSYDFASVGSRWPLNPFCSRDSYSSFRNKRAQSSYVFWMKQAATWQIWFGYALKMIFF